MQSFEELAATSTTPEARRVAERKHRLGPTLADLLDLQRTAEKTRAAWWSRFEWCQARRALAAKRNVKHADVERLTVDLAGGRSALAPGLLNSISPQTSAFIAQIEGMTIRDLDPQDQTIYWDSYPTKIRDIIENIERDLDHLELYCKDGGDLYTAYQRRTKQPASATTGYLDH